MSRFSLNSLRSQLLLWISLPVLVVLLTLALAGVQGHGQAMHELVQTRADSLVRAAAALVSARIDRGQDALVRLSTVPTLHQAQVDGDAGELVLALLQDEFEGGLALYEEDTVLAARPPSDWLARAEVMRLVRQVVADGAPALEVVGEGEAGLLVHAAPVPVVAGGRRVLVGAMPLTALSLPELLRSLALGSPSELTVTNAEGAVLLVLREGSDANLLSAENTVTARATVEPVGWRVQVRQSWTEWIPPVLRFENMLLLVLLAAATLSVLSAYFGVQQIVSPLARLNRAVGALGQGDFEAVQRSVGGVQEIEDLRLALADMARQIRRYQQELQGYIGAMTLGQEEERKRLARELHDETVQALIALNQQVEMAEHRLGQDPERAAERLRELRPLIGDTIAGIRRQIQNLRPLYLEDLGFVPALEMLVQQTAAQHGLVGDFEVSGEPQRALPPAVEISGYRIVQEALRNVANHAQASWIHVALVFEPDAIVLHIEDDGVGFVAADHAQQLAQAGHYGLLGMQERARLHGGDLRIESEPHHGTTVIARLLVPASVCSNGAETKERP